MVSVKEKTINGKKYLYAEYSFRLPNGVIKKISKKIDNEKDRSKKEVKEYFFEKEVRTYKDYSLKKYKTDDVLTESQIEKLEMMRVSYREIIKKLNTIQKKDVLDRFTVNNTYESNAIEGNSLTLKDVILVLKENRVPENKDLREVYETKNTRKAHDFLFENKIKIKIEDIIKLHKIIVENTGVNAGFKEIPNYILMRNLKTTPPEKVEKEMENLVLWYEKNKDKTHPLKLASEFHARFEKIHPFEDGNGRVGRILMNAILLEFGYPPLIIRKTARIAYFSVLKSFDEGYKTKLEKFLLDKLKQTYKNFFEVYVKYL